ncbi:MAG TPA: STAS domain-containing protein [Terriglobales bacterium]|jgi:anti-anti-sigma factor|nr:STAS domain-containing protein [Terriglobales bacterium]
MPNKTFSASGLKLVFEESSQEAIVRCDGRITAASSEMLQREIAGNLIPASLGKMVAVNTRIVLDLSRVTYVDSAGLEAIFKLWRAGQSRSCAVEIVNLTTRGQKLIKMAGLDGMLTKMKSLLASLS